MTPNNECNVHFLEACEKEREWSEKTPVDPFSLIEDFQPAGPKWKELNRGEKCKRIVSTFFKMVALLTLLYLFICSLGFLGDAFRLLGGKAAGQAFTSHAILSNPVAGFMIGLLGTVLLQSSSTTTSIVVAMVASGILPVRPAIPIVMGANMGTSVTNTIVAMGQIADRNQFRRAFAGATVHDMFNMLSVVILLPIELVTGYLYKISHKIVVTMNLKAGDKSYKKELLKKLTKPFTNLFVQLDKKVILAISQGDPEAMDKSLLKMHCGPVTTVMSLQNVTSINGTVTLQNVTSLVGSNPCRYLLKDTGLNDSTVGAIMLVIAMVMLCACLIFIVKTLNSLLRGQIAVIIRKSFNSDFPKPFGFLTGYFAIMVGALLTILVQSSSIFTSTLTPLVGMGMVSIERIYPLTLGANIGTTGTSILAALASSSDKLQFALQISLCHLFFNISGILLWYPIPALRRVPIKAACFLGNTTARYRWFAIAYLVVCFFLLPATLFLLCLAGWKVFAGVVGPLSLIAVFVLIVNFLQTNKPLWLPTFCRSWEWLPLACRSLEPYDRLLTICFRTFKRRSETLIRVESVELNGKDCVENNKI